MFESHGERLDRLVLAGIVRLAEVGVVWDCTVCGGEVPSLDEVDDMVAKHLEHVNACPALIELREASA